nr:MAG TPA_asm: hypothetical protein [Caudoviricetes sp.]
MPNSCSIYAQFLPNKKARPQNGTGFDTGNVVFYSYLILPQRKGSPRRHVVENRRGLLFCHVVHLAGVYLYSMSIVFYT